MTTQQGAKMPQIDIMAIFGSTNDCRELLDLLRNIDRGVEPGAPVWLLHYWIEEIEDRLEPANDG